MTGPFDRYRDTPLWSALESAMAELLATREVAINTAPAYVIGYLCQELDSKKLVTPPALER
jgi:hypothetical protein